MLHGPAGRVQDGSPGGLVDAPGLHAGVAVLHHVHPADAVARPEGVERHQHLRRPQAPAVQRHGVAGGELQLDVLGLVGGILGGRGPQEHIRRRFLPRVLKHAALVADVEQVTVHAVGLGLGDGHGNVVTPGVVDQCGARVEVPHAPRGDHLDIGLQGVVGQLEPHLIVALAGGAVGHGLGVLRQRHLELALGDEGPGDGGAQQVGALVDRVAPEHGEHVVANEHFLEIVHHHLAGAGGQRLAPDLLQIIFLAHVGAVGNDFAVIAFLHPAQTHGRIETARVGKHHLVRFHDSPRCPLNSRGRV